jgi:hypothetical protein
VELLLHVVFFQNINKFPKRKGYKRGGKLKRGLPKNPGKKGQKAPKGKSRGNPGTPNFLENPLKTLNI